MTNEEIKNRVHAIEVLIEAQKRYKDLKEKVHNVIVKEFNKEPQFLDEYDDTDIVKEFQQVNENISETTNRINKMIDNGATLEDIAKFVEEGYVDENGDKHTVECLNTVYIKLLDLNGKRTNIREDLKSNNPEYQFDIFGAYSDLARDVAKKGVKPEELPEDALFDILFVDNYIEYVVETKEIDKNYSSNLTQYMDSLINRKIKGQVRAVDIAQAIKDNKEMEDEER